MISHDDLAAGNLLWQVSDLWWWLHAGMSLITCGVGTHWYAGSGSVPIGPPTWNSSHTGLVGNVNSLNHVSVHLGQPSWQKCQRIKSWEMRQ